MSHHYWKIRSSAAPCSLFSNDGVILGYYPYLNYHLALVTLIALCSQYLECPSAVEAWYDEVHESRQLFDSFDYQLGHKMYTILCVGKWNFL